MVLGVTWVRSWIAEGCAILRMGKTSEKPVAKIQA